MCVCVHSLQLEKNHAIVVKKLLLFLALTMYKKSIVVLFLLFFVKDEITVVSSGLIDLLVMTVSEAAGVTLRPCQNYHGQCHPTYLQCKVYGW